MSCLVGTDVHYRGGCREAECRAAHAEKAREMRRRHRRELAPWPTYEPLGGTAMDHCKGGRYGSPIHCGKCGLEVEACDGRYGEWMHSDGHRELGPDGHVAYPETAGSLASRLAQRTRSA